MKKFQVVVKCSIGIHARPAAQIAQACSNLRAAVTLEVGNETAQGNNVLEILNLHAPKGATVNITVDGPDEEEAAKEIQAVFDAMGPKEKKGSVLKVAFFGTKDYDRLYFSELAKDKGEGTYNVELKYFSSRLTDETHANKGRSRPNK